MSTKSKEVGVDLGLNDDEKAELRRIARTVIEKRALCESLPPVTASGGKLEEKWGAFVSIYKQGMLRGCIGTLESSNPLTRTVEDMAQAAAFRDPRFRPIGPEELPYLELEISVLTPLREVDDPSEIQVGRDGILIRQGSFSGLLLPQVAAERNWDRETFLEETCRKAGLPRHAWKERNTKIYVFSADVF